MIDGSLGSLISTIGLIITIVVVGLLCIVLLICIKDVVKEIIKYYKEDD